VAARSRSADVFINIPFDQRNEYLYLSLIAAIVGLGLAPRSVLEIPHDAARLERIFDLIRSCPCSIHDLSAVRLSRGPFRVPRFNMAFELGLAAAVSLSTNGRHKFRVMDAIPHRVTQSLSDLGGYDAFVHRRSTNGVFEAVADMFAPLKNRPIKDVSRFRIVYRGLVTLRRARLGADVFRPTAFGELVTAARGLVSSSAA
jgi:hypothetical protein